MFEKFWKYISSEYQIGDGIEFNIKDQLIKYTFLILNYKSFNFHNFGLMFFLWKKITNIKKFNK